MLSHKLGGGWRIIGITVYGLAVHALAHTFIKFIHHQVHRTSSPRVMPSSARFTTFSSVDAKVAAQRNANASAAFDMRAIH